MKALDLIHGAGKNPSLQYLLADSRLSRQYNAEVLVVLQSSSTQVILKDEIELAAGKTIDKINVDIRVFIPADVTIAPYQHVGSTGVDAIDMTGIPSDKGIIIENYGTVIGSGGLGAEGTWSGSNQARNGSVGHGGSCFKLVDLDKLILINEGNLYGGKGVGANGKGGRGGNGRLSSGASYSYGGSYVSFPHPVSSATIGQGGQGGEWDGYGYSSHTVSKLNGLTSYYQDDIFSYNGSPTSIQSYPISQSSSAGASGAYGRGGQTWTNLTYGIAFQVNMGFAGNGGAAGSNGGKGSVALGYGQGRSGGTAGGTGGAGGSAMVYSVYGNNTSGGMSATLTAGSAGSAGSSGAKGNGGGVFTNSSIVEYQVVNNGTILSGKDLDGNAGGYLL